MPATDAAPLDTFWLFINGTLVFFMQCGFGMLESGTVQRKNQKNILIKNVADVCIGALAFWLVGFGFAYGSDHKFIGNKDFFAGDCLDKKYDEDGCGKGYMDWYFQFAFAATAATIVSGAVAERTQFICYATYSCIISGFVYPVIVHWVWGGGWLAQKGVFDFAGSGVVHMVGGAAGLIGAIVVGPREGRFKGNRFHVETVEIPHNSVLFMGLGVFILWMGWYGFNTGSTLAIEGSEQIAELVVINTTIAPASCALTCMILSALERYIHTGHMTVLPDPLMNGALAGLVAITAGCAVVTPGMACIIGIVAAFVFLGFSELLKQLKIDDPLDAVPMHYCCGAWGVIAVGFFAKEKYTDILGMAHHGAFYGGGGHLLGWQFCAVVTISLWAMGMTALIFLPMNFFGLARVSAEMEKDGLDHHKHGGIERHTSVAKDMLKRISNRNLRKGNKNGKTAAAPSTIHEEPDNKAL